MKLFDWRPGLSGLICLPEEGSLPGQKPRLYFIAEIDEKGLYEVREDLMRWWEAYYNQFPKLAEQEGKKPFKTPEGENYKRLLNQGYFRLKAD